MAKKKVKLMDICYYRSGDKGNISNIGLMARSDKVYEIIKKEVTPERIKAHFKDWVKGDVIIYPMDNLQSLEIMMYQALGGGATKTLRIDQTGKAMGNGLSKMEIEVDEDVLTTVT
ncbi:MAG: hypothetical protein RI591_04725 [Dehalococcoidia bacterium]|nr:hypothetical protein [Dehalococcoidia bacterium]